MPFRLLLLPILALLPVHHLLATECSDIFSSDQSFNVNGSSSIGSGNECNNTSCDTPPTFTTTSLPALSPSGAFSSTSISNGSAEYTSWGHSKEADINYEGTPDGTAILYFSGDVTIDKETLINAGGDPANVMLVVYGNLTINKESQINAHIYVAGNASLKKEMIFNGGLAVAGALSVDKDGSYTFDPANIGNIDAPDVCEQTVSTVHHYQLIHNNTGLTCATEQVTINACESADCSILSSQNVTMDVYVGSKQIADGLSFQGTSTFDFDYYAAETVVFSLDNVSPLADDNLQCSYANCEITFTDADFTFSEITDQIAGVEFTDIVLTATKSKRAGIGFSCIGDDTFVDKTVTINLAQENLAPSGTSGRAFTLEQDTVSLVKYPDFTAVDLFFNTDAQAVIPKPNYKDAGQIRLQASYSNGGTDITGASNSFWVRPDALQLSARANVSALDNATNSDSPVHKAGADFDFEVTAINAEGDTTLNYAPGQLQLKLQRTGPTSGSNEGTFAYADGNNLESKLSPNFIDVTLTTFSSGSSSYNGARYSEVGLINLDIQDIAYGDNGPTITGTDIDIGRFVPDSFRLTSSQVSGWCGSGGSDDFVYMDQPELEISYRLEALNQLGEVTKNYFDHEESDQDFAKAIVSLQAENNNNGTDLSSRLTGFAGSWVEGVYALENVDGQFSRNAAAADGPFESLIFGIMVNDGETPDPVSFLAELDMNAEDDSECATDEDPLTYCDAKALTGSAKIRFGRWFIENNFGPETSDLPITMNMQYWDGSKFITNIDDSCTTYDGETVNNYAFDNTGLNPALAAAPAIAENTGTGTFLSGSNQNSPLMLSAPGAGNVGNIYYLYGGINDVTPDWLKYDWDNEDNNLDGPFDDSPKGLASFGDFHGNDRIIYWREAF